MSVRPGLAPSASSAQGQLIFPERDGQPMGETGFHVKGILALVAALESRYRQQEAYVGANMFVYYDPSDPAEVVCPDVFVAFGVRRGERRIWKAWEEGKVPDVVFELTSKSTRREDRYTKPAVYESLGIREYFLFDPEGDYLKPRLQGFRLTEDGYQALSGERLSSEALRLEIFAEDYLLRLYDPASGEVLRTPAEHEAAARNAEVELARLRAELERLKKGEK